MATVSVLRMSACGGRCSECGGACHAKKHSASAHNPLGAKAGERVIISASDAAVLGSAFLLYGLPLLLFFGGFMVFYTLSNREGLSILLALLTAAISCIGLHFLDKHVAPKLEITAIVDTDTIISS